MADNAIIKPEQQQLLTFEDVIFHPLSLEIPPDMSVERWNSLMKVLKGIQKGVTWWIGDALNQGEQLYGQMYTQAYDATGRSKSTLGTAKWVAHVFPPEMRRDELDFSHHAEVASLVKDHANVANQILDYAIQEDLPVSKVRAEAKAARVAVGIDREPREGEWGFEPPHTELELTNQWTGEMYGVEVKPEWLQELFTMVMNLATGGTAYSVLRDAHTQATTWAMDHDLPYFYGIDHSDNDE